MMKKNKLYTVNKWNRPMFTPDENIYSLGSFLNGIIGDKKDGTGMSGWLGGNKLSEGAGGLVGGLASSIGNFAGNAISGGLSSGAGNAIGSIGSTVGGALSSVNPLLGGIVSVGSGVVGGIVNGLFGQSVDEEALKDANEGTAAYNNFQSNASSFDDVKGPTAQANVRDVYKDGLFGGDADEKNEALRQQRRDAKQLAFRSVDNNVHNLVSDQMNNALAGYFAYGGNMFAKGGKKFRGKKMPYITHYNSYRNTSIDAMRKAGFTDEEIDDWNINVNRTPGYKRLSDGKIATQPVGGVFGGGEFTGSGATERWTPAYRPSSKDSFNEAYDEARGAGAETFMFGDKEYNTLREANPIREFNNRHVGAGRTEENVRQREGYGKDFGPVRSPLAGIPLITYAYGGPMDGAIGYGFMSDYLLSKNKTAENKDKMTNMFMETPNSMFAFGGDLQTHGADFGTGLTHVNAGGSHSENPYDGVQMGVDSEGTPNLVEENETIFNDYVYSARILADAQTKEKFRLPKKKDITFAEISKKLEKEIAERPNDVISEAGFKAQMSQLAEEQERQKAEMEAQRAKEAFESLSPEEQTAIMQQAAQQEAMGQEAAVQQPTPEEVAMAEQQAMQADGTEANLGTEPPMMAEGGHLFKDGGSKNSGKWKDDKENHWDVYTKPGLKKFISSIKERLDKAKTEEEKAAVRLDAMKQFNDLQKSFADIYPKELTDNYKYSDAVKNHQMMFDKLFGNTGFYSEDEKGNVKNLIEDAINMPSGHATSDKPSSWYDGYFGPRTSIRNFGSTEFGDDAYYQELANDFADLGLTYAPSEDLVYNGNKLYGLSIPEQEKVQKTLGQKLFDALPQENQEAVLAAMNGKKPEETVTPEEEELDIEPVRKSDWIRYAGLFGPAVGLGMMAAGVGKPDYSKLDAAVSSAGNVYTADYKPLGDYLTYRPMDIWYEQNALNAQARATDRALANSTSPSKMAGIIANGYNSQLASGNLYRQALEYNDALREKVASFNRRTNQFNAEAYNRNSQFNAAAKNDATSRNVNAKLHAAQERLNRDAGWYNSLYGNVSGLFKGVSDLGRENRETNWRNALVTSGAMGVVDPDQLVKAGVAKRKKSKKGLTV